MRTSIVLLMGLVALTAVASPALADITIDKLPVHACAGGICTPCLDPIIIEEGVLGLEFHGAAC